MLTTFSQGKRLQPYDRYLEEERARLDLRNCKDLMYLMYLVKVIFDKDMEEKYGEF